MSNQQTPRDRLRQARTERGLSMAELARLAGIAVPTYRHYENPNEDISFDQHVEKLARVLRVEPAWLRFGRGDMTTPDNHSRGVALDVPLISWVSAGPLGQTEAIEQYADAPRVSGPDLDEGGDWIALRVQGDSMDRISPPDSIILVNRRDRRLVPNACYVIADHDGSATYKRYRPPNEWAPVSTNPEHKPFKLRAGAEPVIIGRVRKSIISM
jgi:SOS-response transcriptional repressor LexA